MARRLLGTAVTDENGEATFEYVGEGAGELHIVAESGTFSSNVIVVDDYTPIIASATITSDKNIIQSGGSANLTIIGKDKHNELVNSDTFDLCEQFIISKVSLNSNGIVQSGSTLDVKAKVNTSLGGVPNNVPVVFKKGDEVLNTVQTSTNGVATYGYQGSGVGQVNITAECDGVVSEPYNVFDAIAYFDGVVNNHFKNATETIVDDGIQVTSTSQNIFFQKNGTQLFIPTDTDFAVEFYLKFNGGSSGFYAGFTTANDTRGTNMQVVQQTTNNLYKLTVVDGVFTLYRDGVEIKPKKSSFPR